MGIFNKKYVCAECGGEMKFTDENKDVLMCTRCAFSVEVEEYGHEHDYDDYFDSINSESEEDIPEGCAACGGPYPDCKTSCKIFDD